MKQPIAGLNTLRSLDFPVDRFSMLVAGHLAAHHGISLAAECHTIDGDLVRILAIDVYHDYPIVGEIVDRAAAVTWLARWSPCGVYRGTPTAKPRHSLARNIKGWQWRDPRGAALDPMTDRISPHSGNFAAAYSGPLDAVNVTAPPLEILNAKPGTTVSSDKITVALADQVAKLPDDSRFAKVRELSEKFARAALGSDDRLIYSYQIACEGAAIRGVKDDIYYDTAFTALVCLHEIEFTNARPVDIPENARNNLVDIYRSERKRLTVRKNAESDSLFVNYSGPARFT